VLDTSGIPLSTDTTGQKYPSIAFDGTNYLVVWQDGRCGSYEYDIYGTRVSQTGAVLEPAGIAISTADNSQSYPSIAYDGTNYLVVWEDYRSGHYYDIYAARVSQAGAVLDSNGIAISNAVNDEHYPAITFNETNYFVVWQDRRGAYSDIYGARVSPSGVLIDSFPVSTQEGDQWSPALACGSANQILITYVGWTGEYQGRIYNTNRIWGKFYPFVPGIEEENSKVKMEGAKLLEVYPNPAKTVIRVRVPWSVKEQTDLKIFDVSGKLIKEIATPASQSRNDREIKITLNGISPGIYFFRLGKETKKFLVVK